MGHIWGEMRGLTAGIGEKRGRRKGYDPIRLWAIPRIAMSPPSRFLHSICLDLSTSLLAPFVTRQFVNPYKVLKYHCYYYWFFRKSAQMVSYVRLHSVVWGCGVGPFLAATLGCCQCVSCPEHVGYLDQACPMTRSIQQPPKGMGLERAEQIWRPYRVVIHREEGGIHLNLMGLVRRCLEAICLLV